MRYLATMKDIGRFTSLTVWTKNARIAAVLVMVGALSILVTPHATAATLDVRIDLSDQSMSVRLHQRPLHYWPVSTARRGYRTPVGVYRPVRLERMWYSTKYHNSPMPHSVFFYFGYAIHGTNEIRNLGRPASHGCVRLHPRNAKMLYNLIKQVGRRKTRIIVQQ